MWINERATKRARRKQYKSERRLRKAFGWSVEKVDTIQHGKTKPSRLKPNTPPIRDSYHQNKHKKRKAARAARKRNL